MLYHNQDRRNKIHSVIYRLTYFEHFISVDVHTLIKHYFHIVIMSWYYINISKAIPKICNKVHILMMIVWVRARGTHMCKVYNISHVTRKPVLGGCNQIRLKPACSATKISWSLEISAIASTGIILSRQRTTKALIRLHRCAGWSATLLFTYGINRFSHYMAHIMYCLSGNSDTLLSENLTELVKLLKQLSNTNTSFLFDFS